jgi:hypothetical protein
MQREGAGGNDDRILAEHVEPRRAVTGRPSVDETVRTDTLGHRALIDLVRVQPHELHDTRRPGANKARRWPGGSMRSPAAW